MATKKRKGRGGDRGGSRPRVEIDPAFVTTLASLGMNQAQIAARMGKAVRTFERALAENEEIRAAYEKGKAQGVEELLTLTRKGVLEGQPALTIFSLKNLAGWRDKQEIKADVNMSGWSGIAREIAEGKAPTDDTEDDDTPSQDD